MPPTNIYTLSLHDALPISSVGASTSSSRPPPPRTRSFCRSVRSTERSRSEEHTSELQSHHDLVCRLLLEKKKDEKIKNTRRFKLVAIAGALNLSSFLTICL